MDAELMQLLALKVVYALLMVSVVMTIAGYTVLAERKVCAWMQGRVGPNRTVLPIIGFIPMPVSKIGRGVWQRMQSPWANLPVAKRGSVSVKARPWVF